MQPLLSMSNLYTNEAPSQPFFPNTQTTIQRMQARQRDLKAMRSCLHYAANATLCFTLAVNLSILPSDPGRKSEPRHKPTCI